MPGRLTMSGLARAKACPASLALPQADASSVWSDAGHDRHSLAEEAARRGDIQLLPAEVADLIVPGAVAKPEFPFAYDYVADKARSLELAGARMYDVGPTEVPGTIDLPIILPSGRLIVVDYKGYEDVGDPSENDQILGYALGAARMFDAQEVTVAVAYIEEDDGAIKLTRPLDVREVDALELDAHAARIRAIAERTEHARDAVGSGVTPDVREGSHCKYCPAIPHCPAKQQTLVRLATSKQEADLLHPLGQLTPEVAGLAYERLQAAKALLRKVESQIYALAAHTRIPLPDGRVLGHLVERGNREIHPTIAHQVLLEQHGAAVADAAIEESVSQASIERALKGQVSSVAGAMKSVLVEIDKRNGVKRRTKSVVKPRPASDYEQRKG